MGFRYDMRDKSRQQQEIVRQRDEADRKLKEVSKKSSEKKSEYSYEKAPRLANYEGIYIIKSNKQIFEIRVSGQAIENGPCGLKNIDIYQWLFETATKFAEEVKEYKIFTIMSSDVNNRSLTKDWKNLKWETRESETNE